MDTNNTSYFGTKKPKIQLRFFTPNANGKTPCEEYIVKLNNNRTFYIYRKKDGSLLFTEEQVTTKDNSINNELNSTKFYQGKYDTKDNTEGKWLVENMHLQHQIINTKAKKKERNKIIKEVLSNKSFKLLLRLFLYDFEADGNGGMTRTTGLPVDGRSDGNTIKSFAQKIFKEGMTKPEREKKPHETIIYKNGHVIIQHKLAEGPSVSNVINELRRFVICISLRLELISDKRAEKLLEEKIMKGLFIKNRAGNDNEEEISDNSSRDVQNTINDLFKKLMNKLNAPSALPRLSPIPKNGKET